MPSTNDTAAGAAEAFEPTKSETPLSESERLYRQVIHALPVAVYTTDANGWVTLYNQAAVALWGREPKVGEDRWCGSYKMLRRDGGPLPTEDWPMAVAFRESKPSAAVEVIVERPDGVWRDVLAHPHLIEDSAGKVVGAINVLVDITERKETEAQLGLLKNQLAAELERERNHSSEMQAAMDAVPAGIFIARDASCTVITANRTGYDMLRVPVGGNASKSDPYNPDSISFRPLKDGVEIPPRELPVQMAARSGQPIRDYQFDVEFSDGVRRRLYGNAVPLINTKGNSRGAIGAFIDVTETRRMEQRLRETQKLEGVGLLAGGIAHDFNNILVGVLCNANLGAQMLPPDSPVRPLLDEIVTAGERAAHLTRQMLAYAGKAQFFIEQVDLSDLVRESVNLIKPSISKKISLRLDLASDLPAVRADRSQAQQVIMNLVLNAAESIGMEAGVVSILTTVEQLGSNDVQDELGAPQRPPGTYVRLEVRDTGCGMDEATRLRIFDPFFTTKFTGRGLGLAAVAGIVRGHKGVVRVTSTPQQGTTFVVSFPASGGPAPEQEVRTQSTEQLLPGSAGILIVDDEPVVLRTAKLALERYGYRILVAENGRAAIDIFEQEAANIDLVLLDLSMPGMNGHETLMELEKMKPSIKVLVSSGYSEDEAFERFSGQHLSGFIQKPYTATRLAEMIKITLQGE